MRSKNLAAVFAVTIAAAATPLACGDDEAPPDDGKGNGTGARATGGGGGIGGEDTSGGRGTSGGNGGTSGTSGRGGNAGAGGKAGAAGSATGGASTGKGGASGASDGGAGGAPAGGEGGEGWRDESVERARRICQKTELLECNDYSTCVEDFRWLFFGAPHCGPVAEAALLCLDTRATIEDFRCTDLGPTINTLDANTCDREFADVSNAYCY